ncbi:hypothetical protein P5V15_005431 [Pogonomyrmex californicus]
MSLNTCMNPQIAVPDGCENGDIEEQSIIIIIIRRGKLSVIGQWRIPSLSMFPDSLALFFPSDCFLFHVPDGTSRQNQKKCAFSPPRNFLGYPTRSSSQKSRFLTQEVREDHSVTSGRESRCCATRVTRVFGTTRDWQRSSERRPPPL